MKVADILEVNLFVKYCIYNHIQPRLLDQQQCSFLKDDGEEIFSTSNPFGLSYQKKDIKILFFNSHNKISESDFNKIVKYLNILKLLLI